jgi:hypothetical protein
LGLDNWQSESQRVYYHQSAYGYTNSAHPHSNFRFRTVRWPHYRLHHRLQESSMKEEPRQESRSQITQIQVEAGIASSWWMVTAEWLNPETGRILTFRSRSLNFPPHHHIGERIVVNFDANEPKHYRMEL